MFICIIYERFIASDLGKIKECHSKIKKKKIFVWCFVMNAYCIL